MKQDSSYRAIYGTIPAAQRAQAALPLPGISPVGQGDWITVDPGYADQIAAKRLLLAERPDAVYQIRPEAEPAAQELLDVVLGLLARRPDFDVDGVHVSCPDGRRVTVDDVPPLVVLTRLLQEDICLHIQRGDAHCLMGALLCFPAAWTLTEKIGKPLIAIHAPVVAYDAMLARRVQRLFDGVRQGVPLWRANLLRYDNPALFQPHTEAEPRRVGRPDSPFERSERQTLFRLPQTGAVVFAIHTVVERGAGVARSGSAKQEGRPDGTP